MKIKKEMLKLVKELRNKQPNGFVTFQNTPPLFRWQYPEEPDLMFELLITDTNPQMELPLEEKTT